MIRGNENDNAYCCSNNKTYVFKVAEISNPLLISQNILFNDKINQQNLTERQLNVANVIIYYFFKSNKN